MGTVITSFLDFIRIHEPAELLNPAPPVIEPNKVINRNCQRKSESFPLSLITIIYSHLYCPPVNLLKSNFTVVLSNPEREYPRISCYTFTLVTVPEKMNREEGLMSLMI